MNVLISGHRLSKLKNYNIDWIKSGIKEYLSKLSQNQFVMGYSGMADGIDLWFCEICIDLKIPYTCCIPFEEQDEYMSGSDKNLRKDLIQNAAKVIKCKNSIMVEKADFGLVVWDGNKGGTHNVFQQLLESKKSFYWLNPISEKVYWMES